jgi:hypothetical protein
MHFKNFLITDTIIKEAKHAGSNKFFLDYIVFIRKAILLVTVKTTVVCYNLLVCNQVGFSRVGPS